MFAFSDLVHCQYFVTSEVNFHHYIPYVNASNSDSEHLMNLKFYSLAEKAIKVKLAVSNDSTPIETSEFSDSSPYPMESTTDDYGHYIQDGYLYSRHGNRIGLTPPTTQKPITYVATGRTEFHKHDIGYEIGK